MCVSVHRVGTHVAVCVLGAATLPAQARGSRAHVAATAALLPAQGGRQRPGQALQAGVMFGATVTQLQAAEPAAPNRHVLVPFAASVCGLGWGSLLPDPSVWASRARHSQVQGGEAGQQPQDGPWDPPAGSGPAPAVKAAALRPSQGSDMWQHKAPQHGGHCQPQGVPSTQAAADARAHSLAAPA